MAKRDIAENQEVVKSNFPYIPYEGKDSLPDCKRDKKGGFVSYGEPRYGYRRTSDKSAELLAFFKKPKGIVVKAVRKLKLKSGVNKDDAFYRLLKDNKITEVE